MHPKLDTLRELHSLDIKIIRKKGLRDAFPQSLRRLNEEIERRKIAAEEAEKRLASTRTSSERFDLDIRSIDVDIKKLDEQMAKARSNKEYNAFLSEIASKKADLARIEDRTLEALNAVDELVERVRNVAVELKKAESNRERESVVIEEQIKEIDDDLAKLEAHRPALTGQVDNELLALYERIVVKRLDTALVPVVENTCQGCFMKVTAEVLNALNRAIDVLSCKNCGRILYLP